MKYVRHKKFGLFIFPDLGKDGINHAQMASRLGTDEIISAGFITFEDGKFICFGRSISLGMGVLDDDVHVLSKQLSDVGFQQQ